MIPSHSVNQKEIPDIVYDQMVTIREEIVKNILESAHGIKNVTLNDATAYQKARDLSEKHFDELKKRTQAIFSLPPWKGIAEMILNSWRSQYFLSDINLVREVKNIIQDKHVREEEGSSDWEYE